DGAPDFGLSWKSFQELEEEQEVPFRSRGCVRLGRIGRSAEFRAERTLPSKKARPNDEKQHDCQNGQGGDGIFKHLVRPESGVGFTKRLLRGDAMLSEEIDVANQQSHNARGQNSCVQGEKAGQRMMPVICSADDDFLEWRPNHWD